MLFVGAGVLQQSKTFVKADLTDGLVGYWNFDEGSGTVAHDTSGFGNDGTIYGNPTWTTGISGNAISFDGINDWIDCGNDASLNPSTAITLAAWYKPTTSWYGAGNEPIIDKPDMLDKALAYQYHLGVCGDLFDESNDLRINFDITAGENSCETSAPANTLSFNQWSFIVGTYDGSTMKLYVDEAMISSELVSGTLSNSGQHLRIAKYILSNGDSTFLPGIIDEIRIYDRTLTTNEIHDLFEQTTLVSYWNFDEGTGSIAHDLTGNGHDGTIQNGIWVNGISGKALVFEKTGNVIFDIFELGNVWSVSYWVKLNEYNVDSNAILGYNGNEYVTEIWSNTRKAVTAIGSNYWSESKPIEWTDGSVPRCDTYESRCCHLLYQR